MQIRKTIIILSCAVLLLGGSHLTMKWLEKQKPQRPKKQPSVSKRAVLVKEAIFSDIETHVRAQGRVRTSSQLALVSEAAGKILQTPLALRPGESFKKGQIILKIYDDEALLSLKAQKSSFITTLANILPDIKFDYPDFYPLFSSFFDKINLEHPLPPLPAIQTSKSLKTFLASKEVLNAYYSIKKAEKALERHTIRAPFDGSFKEVYYETGAYVNSGAQVALLLRTDLLEVEVPVQSEYAKWIQVGDKVTLEDEQKTYSTGEVVRIAAFVDERTQSVPVYVQINNQNKLFFSGQYTWVNFDKHIIPHCVRVPRNAIFNSTQMYTVQQDSLLQIVNINIVKMEEKDALINGVDPATLLVIEPLVGAKENAVVTTHTE